MLPALLGLLTPIFGKVVEKVFPDPALELKRMELQTALQTAILAQSAEIEKLAGEIVLAEAKGESWMQRNWRPLTMLTFLALIVCRWMGWVAPHMADSEYIKVWDMMNLGLGGYVVGRSVEKTAPAIATAITAAFKK